MGSIRSGCSREGGREEHLHSHTLPAPHPTQPHPQPPLTAMYGRQPISFVFAMESISCPVSPKSHNLMDPPRFITTLDGLMSMRGKGRRGEGEGRERGGRERGGREGRERGEARPLSRIVVTGVWWWWWWWGCAPLGYCDLVRQDLRGIANWSEAVGSARRERPDQPNPSLHLMQQQCAASPHPTPITT